MKWRHSKEAQAQKDKEKEEPDKSATEPEPKDSECESEPSESEFEDGAEDKSDVDISDLNKASVIIPGAVTVSTQDTSSSTHDRTEPSRACADAAHAAVSKHVHDPGERNTSDSIKQKTVWESNAHELRRWYTLLYYIWSVSICTENVNKRLLLIFQLVYLWKSMHFITNSKRMNTFK